MSRLAYDDLSTPRQMEADCRATRARLEQARLEQAARRAVRPAPSIHFADQPREARKPVIAIDEATARLAGALHFHLD